MKTSGKGVWEGPLVSSNSEEWRGLGLQGSSCGTSLLVQWLRLCASNAGGAGSTPDVGANIAHAVGCHL